MALTPAEKQRRYRARLREKMQHLNERVELTYIGVCPALSEREIEDRDAVMSEPLFPVPQDTNQLPRFMNWTRYEWAKAPVELVSHFGMHEAWIGWKEELWSRGKSTLTDQ